MSFNWEIMNMHARNDVLEVALDRYRDLWQGERAEVDMFLAFLQSHADVFHRSHLVGHFTASSWLVSADGERALLMHHRKLDRWLQPGGHADGERDLAAVALREAEEESGLSGLQVQPEIFDIDRHRIPERGQEPEHWHYDVRYVVRATRDERFVANAESLDMTWRSVEEVVADEDLDASLRRMAHKWLARKPVVA